MTKNALFLLASLQATLSLANAQGTTDLKFRDTLYEARWNEQGLFEFTPEGQDHLGNWEDMFTVNVHPTIKTGEQLASLANNILSLYKQNGGQVVRIDSIPRTPQNEAEHLIVVAFPRPEFIEVVFARLVLINGYASPMIYSHRFYGANIAAEAKEWIEANAKSAGDDLMAFPVATVPQILASAHRAQNDIALAPPQE